MRDPNEGCVDLTFARGIENDDLFPYRTGCTLGFSPVGQSRRKIRVQEYCDGYHRRNHIEQQAQAFLGQLCCEDVDPSRIAAWSGEAGDKPKPDRVSASIKHDGDRGRRSLGRNRRSLSARRDDHRDLSLDKIKCQRLHPVVLALRPAILNDNVAAIDIPDFLQAPTETGDEMGKRAGRRRAEEANHRRRRLLRAHRKRPRCRRAAK